MTRPTQHQALNTPARLIVGADDATTDWAYQFIQKAVCPTGCGTCKACTMVRMHTHHHVTWLSPEKWYTREELHPLFSRIAFAGEEGQPHFFVLHKADTLLITAANSLLKSLEEPPAGYFFILLTTRLESIVPTIRSRCLIEYADSESATTYQHPLFTAFTAQPLTPPGPFLAILEKQNPSEQETTFLLEQLLTHWFGKHKKQIMEKSRSLYSLHAGQQVETVLARPIANGSSKLVLKQLYLQLSQIQE